MPALNSMVQINDYCNRGPLPGRRINNVSAAQHADSLCYPDQAEPRPCFDRSWTESPSVVLNCNSDRAILDFELNRSRSSAGMLNDIVNALLYDSIEVDLFVWGKDTIDIIKLNGEIYARSFRHTTEHRLNRLGQP